MLTESIYTNLCLILVSLILPERFINNNDTPPDKLKKRILKRLQNPNFELKLEVKYRFQGVIPHLVFQVAKLEHQTTPASFIVTYIDFKRDPTLPDVTYSKIMFYNPYSGLKDTSSF